MGREEKGRDSDLTFDIVLAPTTKHLRSLWYLANVCPPRRFSPPFPISKIFLNADILIVIILMNMETTSNFGIIMEATPNFSIILILMITLLLIIHSQVKRNKFPPSVPWAGLRKEVFSKARACIRELTAGLDTQKLGLDQVIKPFHSHLDLTNASGVVH